VANTRIVLWEGKDPDVLNLTYNLVQVKFDWKFVIINMLSCFIIWLAPRAGKMNQIARCDWLPERARWSHLARWGLPAVSRMKNFPESRIINPLLTKFVRSLGQYPAILTSNLVDNPYLFFHIDVRDYLDCQHLLSSQQCVARAYLSLIVC